MKKKQLTVPVMGVLALAASKASAQLVYEPFDYGTNSVGTNLANLTGKPLYRGYRNPMNGENWFDTNTGYAANGPGPDDDTENAGVGLTINNGGLPAPAGLTPSVGNSAQYLVENISSRSARVAVNPLGITSGTVYFSFNFKITDGTNIPATLPGGFFAGFNTPFGTSSTNPATVGTRVQVRQTPDTLDDPTNYQLGVKVNTNTNIDGTTYAYDLTTRTAGPTGDTIFVVGSYTFGPDTGDDTSKMWINPAPATFGAGTAPAPTLTTIAGTDLANISSFMWRQGNLAVPKGVTVDDLRMDTTWAQVTAPAGTQWTGGAGDWSTGWVGGSPPDGAAQFVTFGAGAGGAVNVDTARTVGTINIKNDSTYTLGGSTITLNGDVGGASAINVIPIMHATTGAPQPASHTITAPLALANELALNVGVGQTLTVSGGVSGAAAVSKNGAGVTRLLGTNTFSGGLSITNGILAVETDAGLGEAPLAPATNITISRGGTLRFDAAFNPNANRTIAFRTSGEIDTNGNDVMLASQLTGGDLVKVGAGVLELTNDTNANNAVFINGGSLRVTTDLRLGPAPATPTTKLTIGTGGALQFGASFDLNNNRTIVIGSGGGTIDTNGFNSVFGGNINAASTGGGPLTKAGAGQFHFAGNGSYNGLILKGGTFSVFNDANLGIAGSSTTFDGGALRVGSSFSMAARPVAVNAGGGTFDTNGFDVTAGNVAGVGALTKTSAGNLTVNHVRVSNLTVSGGTLTVAPSSLAAGVSTVATLSIAAGAKVDIKDNKLITTSPAGSATAGVYDGVQGLVQQASAGGTWTGTTGLTTSMPDAPTGLTSIGVISAAQKFGLAGAATATFAGQTVNAASTLAMYTYGGDANLDGLISGDDYSAIDFNIATPGASGWANGDFNHDGIISGDDYSVIDFNIVAQGAPFSTSGAAAGLSGVTAVPEPASLGLFVAGAASIIGRRRRLKSA
jgi:autotransporter-associated beta strand protein